MEEQRREKALNGLSKVGGRSGPSSAAFPRAEDIQREKMLSHFSQVGRGNAGKHQGGDTAAKIGFHSLEEMVSLNEGHHGSQPNTERSLSQKGRDLFERAVSGGDDNGSEDFLDWDDVSSQTPKGPPPQGFGHERFSEVSLDDSEKNAPEGECFNLIDF